MKTKQKYHEQVNDKSFDLRQKRIQKKLEIAYIGVMIGLGAATILSPLFFPPLVYIGGISMLAIKGLHKLDKEKDNALSRWLAKHGWQHEEDGVANEIEVDAMELSAALRKHNKHKRAGRQQDATLRPSSHHASMFGRHRGRQVVVLVEQAEPLLEKSAAPACGG